MSYNTRAGVRMNRPSQNYGNSPAGNNPNYNQPQGYHQNQNTSYTQPAYTTQTNYQNKFQSNQQQQQPQTQPQPQPQTPKQAPPPPAPAPVVVVPPPVIKESPVPQQPPQQPPPPEPKLETDDKGGENSMDTSEDGPTSTPRGPKFRPWNKRGATGKISRKMRKRRQNARLRNLLAPKNAMMVLHELHPELKMVISEQVNAANQTAYTVEIEIEGKKYRGHGLSKMSAKQGASENALKAVLLEKLEQNNLKINPDNTLSSDGSEAAAPQQQQDVQMKEETAIPSGGEGDDPNQPPRHGKRPVEDDVPWGSLASFALFKLFSEWQSQGFQLPPSGLPPVFHKVEYFPPQARSSLDSGNFPPYPTVQAAGSKKIPDDANKKHPVQLLNQIRPGSQYSESREGTPPNLTFKFTVVIDSQTFNGVGTNKKDAKKECAKHALEALGVKYD